MHRALPCLVVVGLVLLTAAPAVANDYLVGGMFQTPPITHYRVAGAPVTVYAPVAPAPVAPAAPWTYVTPGAVTVYSPVVVPAPLVAAQPVVVGRPVVTRTKCYIPGQPIRNLFRWVTPGVPTGVAIVAP